MGRNFANKLWNASRFVLMNLDGYKPTEGKLALELADRWIISRYQGCVDRITTLLEGLKHSDAARQLYAFVWNEFCDWYVELVKERLSDPASEGAATSKAVLVYLLDGILRLIHPYMPFVTSEIWERLGDGLSGMRVELELEAGDEEESGESAAAVHLAERVDDFLVTASWPQASPEHHDVDAEKQMGLIQDAVLAVRNIKGEMNVPPGSGGTVYIRAEAPDSLAALQTHASYLRSMADLDRVEVDPDITRPPASGAAVVRGMEIYLPLEELIDLQVERERLSKEVERLTAALRGAEGKLDNQQFLQRAPAEVVERETEKRDDISKRLQKVEDLLAGLSA